MWKLVGRISARFRHRRIASFTREFGVTHETKVVDIGGTPAAHVPGAVIVNTDTHLNPHPKRVVADGCRLPFEDGAFDVAFSNAVIEHVGDPSAFASEIDRVAKRYWVRAPYFWFPLEPHYLMPFVQFLPHTWRLRVTRLSLRRLVDKNASVTELARTQLPTMADFSGWFPGATIRFERVLGLPKSIIAVKH